MQRCCYVDKYELCLFNINVKQLGVEVLHPLSQFCIYVSYVDIVYSVKIINNKQVSF